MRNTRVKLELNTKQKMVFERISGLRAVGQYGSTISLYDTPRPLKRKRKKEAKIGAERRANNSKLAPACLSAS